MAAVDLHGGFADTNITGNLFAEAPPGDVLLTLTALGDYTLRVPLATPSTPTVPVLGVELALPVDTVAPWWSAGQRIEGTATITNQTSVAQTATIATGKR